MKRFSIAGRTSISAATINTPVVGLWNPSTTRPLWLTAIGWAKTVGTVDNFAILRTSTRGTPASTLTPVQANDEDNEAAPITGALLDLGAYSVAPTLVSATVYPFRWNLPATVGAGFILPMQGDGMKIGPASGLVILTPVAVALQPADVTFFWSE